MTKKGSKKRNDVSIVDGDQQLSEVEITYLRMMENKRADASSVLGWLDGFYNVDGRKIINMLLENGYVTYSDYRFNIKKSTIPVLKDFLKIHNLETKGKKADLVDRVIENISESDCSRYFTQSYYVFTPKALELLRKEKINDEERYNELVGLIRQGRYNDLKRELYPNKNQHWGTEDTFLDTIDFAMKHAFEDFGLPEHIRRNLSSFVALRAVDYGSRGYSSCRETIFEYLHSLSIALATLRLPVSLKNYIKENEIHEDDCEFHYGDDDIYDLYIGFIINRARAVADLNNYKRLHFKKVRISTCRDARTCSACRSEQDKVYSIGKVPLLPLCWDCRCFYSSARS